MSSQIKPIQVYGAGGPNPPKVAMVLAELDIPHEIIATPMSEVKSPEYLKININGRLPSIKDPNTSLTLWESGAILEYLIERYDTKHLLSFPAGSNESYLARQWLYFQTSGHGPNYGQASWFKKFNPEPNPGALERYVKEVNRVSGVLESWLAKQKEQFPGGDGPWLVGDKMSYADLSFVSWQIVVGVILEKGEYDEAKYPLLHEWVVKMSERPKVKQVIAAAFAASSG